MVCGAWHAPALIELGPAKADDALLKGLPKVISVLCDGDPAPLRLVHDRCRHGCRQTRSCVLAGDRDCGPGSPTCGRGWLTFCWNERSEVRRPGVSSPSSAE